MKKLTIPGSNFHTKGEVENFAKFLSRTIEGTTLGDFQPYPQNGNNDRRWTLDRGNNWWVNFPDDCRNVIELQYRYQCEMVQAEEALAAWLAFRVNATLRK